jgi:hypothetical protein
MNEVGNGWHQPSDFFGRPMANQLKLKRARESCSPHARSCFHDEDLLAFDLILANAPVRSPHR